MMASTEPFACASSSRYNTDKMDDGISAQPAQECGPQRQIHGFPEAEKTTARRAMLTEQPHLTAAKLEKGKASNGHGPQVSAEGSQDGGYRPNGDENHHHNTVSFEATAPSGTLGAGLAVRHSARPDSPIGSKAASPAHRSNNSAGSAPQSPRRATSTTTHGSFRPPTGPSATNRQRHSHTGVSIPEGGLFGLLRRPSPQPFHPPAIRASRSGAGPAPAGAGSTMVPRTRRTGGAAVVASAAAVVAAARPSPGALIRYILAPIVLLPVAWPWLLLRSAQALLTAACLLAAAVVDLLILLADVLRRNRNGAEVLSTWASGWLAWVVVRYWAGLAQLHAGCEEALGRISQLVMPMLAAALSRSPAAARMVRLFSPVLAAVAKAQDLVYGAYCFVHDEIVPVALDLAERLPLVHGLLHRAVVGGSA